MNVHSMRRTNRGFGGAELTRIASEPFGFKEQFKTLERKAMATVIAGTMALSAFVGTKQAYADSPTIGRILAATVIALLLLQTR